MCCEFHTSFPWDIILFWSNSHTRQFTHLKRRNSRDYFWLFTDVSKPQCIQTNFRTCHLKMYSHHLATALPLIPHTTTCNHLFAYSVYFRSIGTCAMVLSDWLNSKLFFWLIYIETNVSRLRLLALTSNIPLYWNSSFASIYHLLPVEFVYIFYVNEMVGHLGSMYS